MGLVCECMYLNDLRHDVFIYGNMFCYLRVLYDINTRVSLPLLSRVYHERLSKGVSGYSLPCTPKPGMVVCGRFTSDDQWYRARIIFVHYNTSAGTHINAVISGILHTSAIVAIILNGDTVLDR